MEKKCGKNEGAGCLTIVGIVLITLKLTSVEPVAGWSWFWVLSPFWGPVALVFAVAAIAGFTCVKDDDKV